MRDGGYYNNWEFSLELAQEYINSIHQAGIQNIELGFRNLKSNLIKGPNWFTNDNYIKNLKIPKEINLGVMCNVFDITSSQNNLNTTIEQLFPSPRKTKVKFIRLASHFKELSAALKITKILKDKGFFVCLNLMQITEQPKERIIEAGKLAQEYKPDVLYFADSLGRMSEKEINEVILNIRKYWSGEIGIHAHDNLSKALSNSLYALKNGVTWVDSTISGMGRGPGNVKTEELILEEKIHKNKKLKILPIIKILDKYFNEMKKFYQWGTNPYYYLAGKYGIHPTYIQEMLSQKLTDVEIINLINKLKGKNGNKYDINLIRSEFQKPLKISKGIWSPSKKFKNKELLFLASGQKLKQTKTSVEKYISTYKPVVIALKKNIYIDEKFINYYIACNPLRIMSEIKILNNLNKPLIIPKILLKEKIKSKFKKLKILDFGIGLKDNKFEFFKNCAHLNKLYTISYAWLSPQA